MKKKNDLREKLALYLLFSLMFWAFAVSILYSVFKRGSVTTACWDAITQMYPVMLYVSRLLRSFVGAIFTGETFVFHMLEWNLGMGENTIGVLNWHGFGDPFYLLTVFATDESLPYWYSFIMYLKIYASGLAFIAMAREMSKDKSCYAYIIGALLYCFCGFTQISNMHVIFLHALVYTPLMLMAAHKHIYNTEYRWGVLLTFATACFALSGFYFFYIASVSMAVYVLYQLYRKRASFKESRAIVLRLIREYLLGIGLVAVIFIPSVVWFLSSDRVGVSENISLFDSWGDILKRIANIALPQYNGEQVLSISAVGIVCILLVFARRKKREIANLLLLFVLTCIPFMSCIMSGFGEIYDRWEYVIILYWAYLAVEIWDDLKNTTVYEIGFLLFFDAALYALGRKLDWDDTYHFVLFFKLFTVMAVSIAIYRILMLNKAKWLKNVASFAVFAVAVVTVCMTWKEVKGDREVDYVTYRDVIAELLPNRESDEFYRIEYEKTFAEPRLGMNLSVALQYPGVSEYFSMTNNAYYNSFPAWSTSSASHNIGGLNYRSILETLCGVKYYIGYSDNSLIVPYGFEEVSKTLDGEYTLYENKYALPLAYTYEQIYSEEDYSDMNALEKQQVMLQAAALEEYEGGMPCMGEYENNISMSEYEIVSMEGVTVDDSSNTINVTVGSIIRLNADLKAGCENYIVCENLSASVEKVEIEGFRDTKSFPKVEYSIVNLGSVANDEVREVTIHFSKDTEISMDSFHICAYDFSDYGEYIERLEADTAGKIEVSANQVRVNVSLAEDKILCLAVPYGKGWSAYIDGERVEIYKTNDMFMGIEVPEGDHSIVFKYWAEGIRAGIAISLVSLIALIALALYHRKKKSEAI